MLDTCLMVRYVQQLYRYPFVCRLLAEKVLLKFKGKFGIPIVVEDSNASLRLRHALGSTAYVIMAGTMMPSGEKSKTLVPQRVFGLNASDCASIACPALPNSILEPQGGNSNVVAIQQVASVEPLFRMKLIRIPKSIWKLERGKQSSYIVHPGRATASHGLQLYSRPVIGMSRVGLSMTFSLSTGGRTSKTCAVDSKPHATYILRGA
jgi:hypothetical protein